MDDFLNLDTFLLLEDIKSARQREVFTYYYIYGFPDSEISDLLDVSIDSVKTYRRRVIRKLRREFFYDLPSKKTN
jgi:DNA-directed RNA polymerase specialized sigma24 family protein